MKAVLTRDFSIAPEGHTVFHYKTGDQVSGKVAEIAIENDAAIEVSDIASMETKIAPPSETKVRRAKTSTLSKDKV